MLAVGSLPCDTIDALDSEPDKAGIWVECGDALKESGKPLEAEVAYREALRLAAKNTDTFAHYRRVLK
jgi:cytochrome c-type biogenesis protein CcmH/NrfG